MIKKYQQTKFSIPKAGYVEPDAQKNITKTKKVKNYSLLTALTLVVLVVVPVIGAQFVSASHVDPVLWDVQGNVTCADINSGLSGLKVDPPDSGDYTDGTLEVSVDINGAFTDWSSNIGVDYVIIKGGPSGTNVYSYDPKETEDEGLQTVTGIHAVSHVSFCYDEVPEPELTYLTVVKQVINDDTGSAVVGDFTLYVDANQVVSGIQNPVSPGTYTVSEDLLQGYDQTSITCTNQDSGGSVTLQEGDNVTCTIVNDDVFVPEPTLGSIAVCKLIINNEDNVIVGPSDPLSEFKIYGMDVDTSAGVSAGVIGISTFTTPLSFSGDVIESYDGNDVECSTYNDLELGGYYYSEEEYPSTGWEDPLYNDQFTNTVTNLVDFYTYSGELFDLDFGNDGGRNKNADGHIVLTESRPNRILVVLNQTKIPIEPDPTYLTLVKQVINDNGGTALATDWTLSASGATPISGVTGSISVTNAPVDPDTYNLTETGPSGYTASDWSCVVNGGIAALGGSVALSEGDNAVCTIVNDDVFVPEPDPTYLTVVKQVINDNQGTAVIGDFTLYVDQGVVTSGYANPVSPGTYTVSEDLLQGYDQTSITCTNQDSGGSVTLQEGDNVTCTIVNDDIFVPEPETYTIDGYKFNDENNNNFWDDGEETLSGFAIMIFPEDDPMVFVYTDQNGYYSFSGLLEGTYILCEANEPGWIQTYPADNQGCYVNINLTSDVSGLDFGNYEIPVEPNPAYLTVVKEVINNDGGNAVPVDFTLYVDVTEVSSGETLELDAGTYIVSEDTLSGYTLESILCTNEDSGGSVTLSEGDEVTCTLTNNDNPTPSGGSPNLQIEKSVTPTITDPNTTVDYTIVVRNIGGATAINVVLTDVLPTNFTYTDTSLATRSWSLGNMVPGSSQTVTFSADVDASTLPGNYINRAEVSASNHGIRFDEATVTVRGVLGEEADPVLVIEKVGDKTVVNPGGQITYTVSITNTGEAPAVDVVVTDVLPEGFTLAEDGSTTITWEVALIKVGETWETSFLVDIDSGVVAPGDYINEVSATAGNYSGQLFASYAVVSQGKVLGETGVGPMDIAIWIFALLVLAGSVIVFRSTLIAIKQEN